MNKELKTKHINKRRREKGMGMKKGLLKQVKGITLIALVVTIVVLIILATISINSVLRRKWDNSKSTGSKRDVQ